MPNAVARITLHLLLLVSLLFQTGGWQAWAATASHDIAVATSAPMTAAMPCDDRMSKEEPRTSEPPCEQGCCPQPTCDLSACITTGLLPRFASLPAATMPPVPFVFPWHSGQPTSWPIDTLLRPPIA